MSLFSKWQPARLTRGDSFSLSTVLVAISVIYSGDYLFGNDEELSPINTLEAAAPLWLWGTGIGVAGAVLLLGILIRKHAVVWMGHVLLSALYCGLVLGVFLGISERLFWDGVRTAGGLSLLPYLHILFALRTGPRPLGRSDGHADEVIFSQGDGGASEGE